MADQNYYDDGNGGGGRSGHHHQEYNVGGEDYHPAGAAGSGVGSYHEDIRHQGYDDDGHQQGYDPRYDDQQQQGYDPRYDDVGQPQGYDPRYDHDGGGVPYDNGGGGAGAGQPQEYHHPNQQEFVHDGGVVYDNNNGGYDIDPQQGGVNGVYPEGHHQSPLPPYGGVGGEDLGGVGVGVGGNGEVFPEEEGIPDVLYLNHFCANAFPPQNESSEAQLQADASWEPVRDWLRTHSAQEVLEAAEQRDDAGKTALHFACQNAPPKDVIDVFLSIAANTVQWPDTSGWLPIRK